MIVEIRESQRADGPDVLAGNAYEVADRITIS
jgi:hypothetical protein